MLTAIEKQSPNIAQGVHLGKKDEDIGAGDQVSLSFTASLLCASKESSLCGSSSFMIL